MHHAVAGPDAPPHFIHSVPAHIETRRPDFSSTEAVAGGAPVS